MSQENVDLVMRLFNTPELNLVQVYRDETLFAAALETAGPYLSPDFTVIVHGGPEGDMTFVGTDGFREFWKQWLAPYVTFRQEIIRAVDLGDSVLLLVHDFARLAGSDEEMRGGTAAVWSVRDGKIALAEFYATHSEALKAVGLEE
jgi:ketosteroid isomerase-like protein